MEVDNRFILAQTNLICVGIERNYIGNKLSILLQVLCDPTSFFNSNSSESLNTKLDIKQKVGRC